VTEKPFDALVSGTVPVYLGDSAHLKSLLPDDKAAIHISDFHGNITALAEYLTYLTTNETAYEEHRAWRKAFSYEKNIANKPLLQKSWFCRVCEWAAQTAPLYNNRTRACTSIGEGEESTHEDYNGRAVRGNGREVYYVENNTLRSVPNLDTFFALKLELEKVVQISNTLFKRMPKGPAMPAMSPPSPKKRAMLV